VGEDPNDWASLDARTVAVSGALTTVTVAVLGAGAVVAVATRRPEAAGPAALWTLAAAVVLVLGAVLLAWARWRCSGYRVTPERVELHTGILVRRRRSMPLHRVRAVDVTAGPVLRTFGLVALRIGTGQQRGRGEATLALRPVDRMDAERLRTLLLDRMRSAGGPPAGAADGRIAELDPRWLRYGVLTAATPVLGGGLTILLVAALGPLPLWLALVLVPPIGAAAALLLYAETWSGFRLDREPGDTLRMRRGVLTTRSISLEERRLAGVELVEPLGARLAGAARVDAVATGLLVGGSESTEHRTLLPTSPRRLAERVAAVILGESRAPTAATLTPHPLAARDRRLRRAALAVAVPVVALALTGIPALMITAGVLLAVGGPLAAAVAVDLARGLGHAVSGDYLVVRAGSLRRSTVALRRAGVVGWTVRQTLLQRRRGLATVVATTAAGRGAFHAHDVDARAGVRLAATATPGLVVPFMTGEHARVAGARGQEHQARAEEGRDPGQAVERDEVEQHQLAHGRRHQHEAGHP
jgi:putative membrane protein